MRGRRRNRADRRRFKWRNYRVGRQTGGRVGHTLGPQGQQRSSLAHDGNQILGVGGDTGNQVYGTFPLCCSNDPYGACCQGGWYIQRGGKDAGPGPYQHGGLPSRPSRRFNKPGRRIGVANNQVGIWKPDDYWYCEKKDPLR